MTAVMRDGNGLTHKFDASKEMKKIFRLSLEKDPEGEIRYHPITEVSMDETTFDKIGWKNGIAIIDYLDHSKEHPRDIRIIAGLTREILELVSTGMRIEYEVRNQWDEIFNSSKRQEMRELLKESDDEPRS